MWWINLLGLTHRSGEGAMKPKILIRLTFLILTGMTPASAQSGPAARGGAAEAFVGGHLKRDRA